MVAQVSSIIDGCDSEIARLKRLERDFGAWFDAVLDRYADAFLQFGLLQHSYAILTRAEILSRHRSSNHDKGTATWLAKLPKYIPTTVRAGRN